MTPYKLKDKKDNRCGALALAAVLESDFETINLKGWNNTFCGNDDDSYLHHKAALKKMNVGYKPLSYESVIAGHFTSNKALILLLTNDSNPVSYHWFILNGADNKHVFAYDGIKESVVKITHDRIKSGWGVFSAAYEVIPATNPIKLGRFERFWLWITGIVKIKIWG